MYHFIIKNKIRETLNKTCFTLSSTSRCITTLPPVVCIRPHLGDHTEFWPQRQHRVAAQSAGQRGGLGVVFHAWRCTESHTLKFPCPFLGLDHVAFDVLIWLPSCGFVLQQIFLTLFLPHLHYMPPDYSLEEPRRRRRTVSWLRCTLIYEHPFPSGFRVQPFILTKP